MSNVPAPLTSFVGREGQQAALLRLLHSTRLLTLAGPGGIGKTRLALEVALEAQAAQLGEVWLVELGPLSDAELVPRAVTAALGTVEERDRPVAEAVIDRLRQGPALLVLDNCEHLVGACATFVDQLLRGCPQLIILATSREVLRVPGEAVWPVMPLAEAEAVELFLDRAAASVPTLQLDDARSQALVSEIVRELEGIPLALELAAARLNLLGLSGLAAGLHDRFATLRVYSRDAPQRHQALRSTVAWSYDLLSDAEQRFFERVSIFAGGFTLEAAEAVSGTPEALDLLGRLVEKSLLIAEPTSLGSMRYRLLETLREYGQERLIARGEHTDAQRHRAAYLTDLAVQSSAEQLGPRALEWINRLRPEHDNLRSALRWGIESGHLDEACALGSVLFHYWAIADALYEGWGWLSELLHLPGTTPEQRARLRFGQAQLAVGLGDYATLPDLLAGQPSLREQLTDPQWAAGLPLLEGLAAAVRGDASAARDRLMQGQEAAAAAGLPGLVGWYLNARAGMAYVAGAVDEARALAEQAVEIGRQTAYALGTAQWSSLLASIRYRQGEVEAAHALYEESLRGWQAIGGPGCGHADVLLSLGQLYADQGDDAHAELLLRHSLALWLRAGARLAIPRNLEGFAYLAATRAQPARALRLAGAASGLRAHLNHFVEVGTMLALDPRALEQRLASARASLSPAAADAAWSGGRELPLERAVSEALQGPQLSRAESTLPRAMREALRVLDSDVEAWLKAS